METLFDLSVTKVIAANRLLRSQVGVTVHRYNRECWGLSLKVAGKTVYYDEMGNEVLSNGLHPVILPKGSTYHWKCVEPGECLVIEFDAEQTGKVPLGIHVLDSSMLTGLFSQLERKLLSKHPAAGMECKALMYQALVNLAKAVAKDYISPSKQHLVQPAVDYMSSFYYDTRINNDFLAQQCRISTVYFRKSFEKVYGIAPMKYLQNLRMEKAKAILASDYESIEQVGRSVGYNSIYHFSKMFKQYTGLSPRQYKK